MQLLGSTKSVFLWTTLALRALTGTAENPPPPADLCVWTEGNEGSHYVMDHYAIFRDFSNKYDGKQMVRGPISNSEGYEETQIKGWPTGTSGSYNQDVVKYISVFAEYGLEGGASWIWNDPRLGAASGTLCYTGEEIPVGGNAILLRLSNLGGDGGLMELKDFSLFLSLSGFSFTFDETFTVEPGASVDYLITGLPQMSNDFGMSSVSVSGTLVLDSGAGGFGEGDQSKLEIMIVETRENFNPCSTCDGPCQK